MAPPGLLVAELPSKVEFTTETEPCEKIAPPPIVPAELPANVEPETCVGALLLNWAKPPPEYSAELFAKYESVMVVGTA